MKTLKKRGVGFGAGALAIAAFLVPAGCQAHKAPHLPLSSSRAALPFSAVTYRGELATRFNAAMANVLTHQDRYSLASYVSNASAVPGAALWPDWPGDQFGRMFSVMHVAAGYGWTQPAVLRKAVGDVILPCQTRNGNFGREGDFDPKDAKAISGNAFGLRGLMDAFEDSGDARFLVAARRLARYYEASFDAWKDNGRGMLHEYFGHAIDGLVKLGERGGEDAWALDLARRAAALTGRTNHAHHSLSMYRGVIDAAAATGDRTLLARAEDYLQWCRENRIASGGLPESMPKSYEDEGCAEADYVVVNLMMFKATGEDRCLDDAERTLVNHFFMNQFHTGGFGHRLFETDVIGGKGWQGWDGRFGSENPGCCSMWGAWALGQVGQYIVTRETGRPGGRTGAVDVNLFPSVVLDLGNDGTRLEIESDFPRMRTAAITVRCDRPRKLTLRLRVPDWADGMTVKVNGREAARRSGLDATNGRVEGAAATTGAPAGRAAANQARERIVIDRRWRSGDRIDIAFSGGLRLVPWPATKPGSPNGGASGADLFAVFDGPLCLAISSAESDVDAFDRILVDGGGKLLLSPDGKPQAVAPNGAVTTAFRPIADDWLSPDVKNPHRLRILFGVQMGSDHRK